eukprot:PRCOL_00003543-RA
MSAPGGAAGRGAGVEGAGGATGQQQDHQRDQQQQQQQQAQDDAGVGAGSAAKEAKEAEKTPQEQLFTACAMGEADKVRELLANKAEVDVQAKDATGYHALQWAALNNRTAVVQLLLDAGAVIDARDSVSEQGAIHWAAVRGSTQALDLLLSSGASLLLADNQGYTAMHVAAQYGATALIWHLVHRWEADWEVLDSAGRTPLHWAAYKNFGDTTRLLMFLGADLERKDNEGCMALHWAAVKGNFEASRLLLLATSSERVLDDTEKAGKTAADLARDGGHGHIALFIDRQKKSIRQSKRRKCKGMEGMAPGLWAFIIGLTTLFFFALRNFRFSSGMQLAPDGLPMEGTASGSIVVTFGMLIVFATVSSGLALLYHASTTDPGYVPIGGNKGPGARGLSAEEIAVLNASDWQRLCPTCKVVKPPRAKHDSVTNRCVLEFDHYCPWTGAPVAKGNHRSFVTFLLLETTAMVVALLVAIYAVCYDHDMPWGSGKAMSHLIVYHSSILTFFAVDGFGLISVLALTCYQMNGVARNILTAEDMRAHFNASGNPYDRGSYENMRRFFKHGSHGIEVAPDGPKKCSSRRGG